MREKKKLGKNQQAMEIIKEWSEKNELTLVPIDDSLFEEVLELIVETFLLDKNGNPIFPALDYTDEEMRVTIRASLGLARPYWKDFSIVGIKK